MSETRSLLEMIEVDKSFPGVHALDRVSLHVLPGECLALVGENGAGKSTLMKILSGVYAADSGEIRIDGSAVEPHNPHHAQELGISIIYQEFNLLPNLSVEENIFIGREPNTVGFVHKRQLRQDAMEFLRQLGVDLDPRAIVRNLSVAQQQMVEIAKALSFNARIVIMDEPTSALTDTEVGALFRIVEELKSRRLGVIFITHRLEEVFEISERITVLRDGKNAGDLITEDATAEQIVQMMVGRSVGDLFAKEVSTVELRPVLEIRRLSRRGTSPDAHRVVLSDVNLTVRAGEIVGLAGLVGSGRTELARAVFGADQFDSGEILVEDELITMRGPRVERWN